MERQVDTILILSPENVPPELAEWLEACGNGVLLVSLDRLADGRLVLQALPDVEPQVVARVRKILAQHADVLRRLA
jgi:hypothetical protein